MLPNPTKFDKKSEDILNEDKEILDVDEGPNGGPPTDTYGWNKDDWYSIKTGVGVSGYTLDERTKNIVKSIRKNSSIYD